MGWVCQQTQFTHEIDLAERVWTRHKAAWPDAICGSSLVAHRVHGRDPIAERRLGCLWYPSPNKVRPSPTQRPPGPAAAIASPDTDIKSDNSDEADGKPAPDAVSPPPTPAQQIIGWLTFNGQAKEGQSRRSVPDFLSARLLWGLYAWLSDNSAVRHGDCIELVPDWIGPIPDPKSVTREEALLRTIQEHLQLPAAGNCRRKRNSLLWSQYLPSSSRCR
ncbi:MAG: hypothetical protein R3C56_16735 [Pirellulaceae bacterium]